MCAERDITVMVGGKEEIFKECGPIFRPSQNAFHRKEWLRGVDKTDRHLVLGFTAWFWAKGSPSQKSRHGSPQNSGGMKDSAAYSKAMIRRAEDDQ